MCIRDRVITIPLAPQIQRGFPVDIVRNTNLLTYLQYFFRLLLGQRIAIWTMLLLTSLWCSALYSSLCICFRTACMFCGLSSAGSTILPTEFLWMLGLARSYSCSDWASYCTDYHMTSLLFLHVTCPCSLRTYATLKFIRSSSSSSSSLLLTR